MPLGYPWHFSLSVYPLAHPEFTRLHMVFLGILASTELAVALALLVSAHSEKNACIIQANTQMPCHLARGCLQGTAREMPELPHRPTGFSHQAAHRIKESRWFRLLSSAVPCSLAEASSEET